MLNKIKPIAVQKLDIVAGKIVDKDTGAIRAKRAQ